MVIMFGDLFCLKVRLGQKLNLTLHDFSSLIYTGKKEETNNPAICKVLSIFSLHDYLPAFCHLVGLCYAKP